MKIKYRYLGKEKVEDMETIISNFSTFSLESDIDEISRIEEKVDNSFKFTARMVELLYDKGLIDRDDVANILSDFIFSDTEIELI